MRRDVWLTLALEFALETLHPRQWVFVPSQKFVCVVQLR